MSKPSSPIRQVIRWLVLRDGEGEKAVDGEARGVSADQGGGAAVGEDQEGEHLLQLMRLLKMQRAEFKIQDQTRGFGHGADDVMRRLERVDGGVTAHEADHGAFDGRVEAEMVDAPRSPDPARRVRCRR